MTNPSPRRRPLPLILLLLASTAMTCPLVLDFFRDYSGYTTTVTLAPGADLPFRLRSTLLTVKPGTIVELPAGRWTFRDELVLDVPHVAIRGQGMTSTILDFATQEFGANALLVTSDEVSVQDLSILDPIGDGIRFDATDGVVIERVRVEWTSGADPNNGAYGFYPVGCSNVLVQGSVVIGASDAGIYVGQSSNIVVRRNQVRLNVAGIEIENSTDADVYENLATENTGAILVFDLPGLPVQGGQQVRVFDNFVIGNNTPNFGRPGTTLALVPGGTGILVMANDDIEIYDNEIIDHDTFAIAIADWQITNIGSPVAIPAGYDPYAERINIHDNNIVNSGAAPQGAFGLLTQSIFAQANEPMPSIVLTGWLDPTKVDPQTGQLPDNLKVCIRDNPGTVFGSLNGLNVPLPLVDVTAHDCTHAPVAATALVAPAAIPVVVDPYTPAEIDALCNAPGVGVNVAALVVDCAELSDYRLFADPAETRMSPTAPGVLYDLSTLLHSDYAQKYRFVYLPPGQAATYDDTAPFDFPVGTVIAKTFTFAHDLRDVSLGEDWVETRLLIHRTEGWVGLPYIPLADGSDAALSIGGGEVAVNWTHFDGSQRGTNYQIPHIGQCGRCHASALGDSPPIGPKVGLLNFDRALPAGGSINQIAEWEAAGILAGVPIAGPAPGWPAWDDDTDPDLDGRARAYLDINCAHCHSQGGRASFTNFWLEFDRPLGQNTGVCKSPVAAGPGAGNLLYDIVPGAPDESLVVFRMDSAAPAIRMPELSKTVVHDEGVALVSAWITTLQGSCP